MCTSKSISHKADCGHIAGAAHRLQAAPATFPVLRPRHAAGIIPSDGKNKNINKNNNLRNFLE
jgi:hypothetical protein